MCDDGDADFSLDASKAVLVRTPATLRALLLGLGEEWTEPNHGPGTWSTFQVVGHMAHVEECDWMDRTISILAEGGPHAFQPVDREAGFVTFERRSLAHVLERFAVARTENLS